MLFRSTIAMKCFQERYAVILAIKLISGMRRIQKVINKIANHLFCAVQPINNSKKQNNCFRQSFTRILKTSQILPHYDFTQAFGLLQQTRKRNRRKNTI